MTSFINSHREQYGVEPICNVLPTAPSAYYEGKARETDHRRLPARARRDGELREQIGRVWKENFGVYGVRKVWRQLNREGVVAARCTVARRMRELGLRGVVRGRRVNTTTPVATLPCPADRVNRVFQVPRPNALWLADLAQTARTCIYGHLEECNAQRLSTSSLRRRLRLTLDDPVRPPHHPTDNPVVSVQKA